MPQHEIEIIIQKDGCVEVEARGFKGRSCSEVAKMFEEIVGELRAERKTSEFYEPEEQIRFNLDQRH